MLDLAAGRAATLATGDAEMLVLPLAGGCAVDAATARRSSSPGGASVFAGASDFVYVPRDADGRRSPAPTAAASPCRRRGASGGCRSGYLPADAVPVELRGAGQASRQVNNFCTPDAFEADRLIACEVLTPGGNWSSYPPHKHDEATGRPRACSRRSTTSRSPTARHGPGMAYQRVYGHDRASEIDVLAEVRTGDVVLIPHGWHGPSMAAPGYDLYYLNVMAGPGDERAWLICDDPAHAWVRETWDRPGRRPAAAVPGEQQEDR